MLADTANEESCRTSKQTVSVCPVSCSGYWCATSVQAWVSYDDTRTSCVCAQCDSTMSYREVCVVLGSEDEEQKGPVHKVRQCVSAGAVVARGSDVRTRCAHCVHLPPSTRVQPRQTHPREAVGRQPACDLPVAEPAHRGGPLYARARTPSDAKEKREEKRKEAARRAFAHTIGEVRARRKRVEPSAAAHVSWKRTAARTSTK